MRVCLFVVLVLAVLYSSEAVGQRRKSFEQLLTKSKVKAAISAAGPSYGYEPLETIQACLEEYRYSECRFWSDANGTDIGGYFESHLTCCDVKADSHHVLPSVPLDVGTCEFTETYLNPPVEIDTDVQKIGTYYMTCMLDGKADECGHPFCAEMALTSQGALYSLDNQLVSDTPDEPQTDVACGRPEEGSRIARRIKGSKIAKSTAAAAQAKLQSYYGEDDGNEYRHGLWRTNQVTVYYGPLEAFSKYHTSVHKGWLEYVWGYDQASAEANPVNPGTIQGDEHVFAPFQYKMTFVKDDKY